MNPKCNHCPVSGDTPCLAAKRPEYAKVFCAWAESGTAVQRRTIVVRSAGDSTTPKATQREATIGVAQLVLDVRGCDYRGPKAACGCSEKWVCLLRSTEVYTNDCYICMSKPEADPRYLACLAPS
jgi:hypothetical protein